MPISERDKARNRAARQVRDKAYAQRVKAYRGACEAVDQDEAVVKAKAEAEDARAQWQAAFDLRESRTYALRAQIEVLQQKIGEVIQQSKPELAALDQRTHTAWDAWRACKQRREDEVEARFPDLQGPARWSAAAWEIPESVQAQMEAARQAVEAEGPAPVPASQPARARKAGAH